MPTTALWRGAIITTPPHGMAVTNDAKGYLIKMFYEQTAQAEGWLPGE